MCSFLWLSDIPCFYYAVSSFGFLVAHSGKDSACLGKRHKRCEFDPWVRKIPWGRKWQPTPVFLPGKFHGQGPGRLQSTGSQRVGHDRATKHTHTHTLVLSIWPEDWGWWVQQKCCRLDFTSNIWNLSSAMVLLSCNSKRSPHVRIIPSNNVLATARLAACLHGKASIQWQYIQTITRTCLDPWEGGSWLKFSCWIVEEPAGKGKWPWEYE